MVTRKQPTLGVSTKLLREPQVSGSQQRRSGSRLSGVPEGEWQNLVKDLEFSFMSVDSRGNIKHKTPQAAIVACQNYLMATQPSPYDPRSAMHRAALASLGMVGERLLEKDIAGV
jgi:hypothetical protein